jgi:hypothetical protein
MASKSSSAVVSVIVSGALLVTGSAGAQDAPPPRDVPTAPVPLDPNPIVPGTAPKADAPPAPAAPTPSPEPPADKKKDASDKPKDGGDKGKDASGKPTRYNNEGFFRVAGEKGGYVGGSGTGKTKSGTPAPASNGGGAKKGGKSAPVAAKKVAPTTIAQWPGFQLTADGGSEVMVEFTTNIGAPTEHKAAGTLTYVFSGAHIAKHNNQNPLITLHWNTPVATARLVPKGAELHLVIELRPGVSVAPSTGIRAGGDGTGQQFFVKFGAGSFLPAGDDDGAMEPSPKRKKAGKTGEAATATSAAPAGSAAPAPAPSKPPSGGPAGPKD